jgi:nitrous oxidase accessory protein NosD
MKRKWLAIGIILLFVGTSIIPAMAQDTWKQTSSRGNWLYVGGSGPGNYTKIQDAIDASSDGDTIFIFDDSSPYHESIFVNKSLSIIGENRDTTVLECSGWNTISIYAEHSLITGLTISQGWFNVEVIGNYNSIIGNKFTNGSHGVFCYEAGSYALIENNIFFCGWPICLESTKGVLVRNNSVWTTDFCVEAYDISSVQIENNTITGPGMDIQGDSNVISNNTIFWDAGPTYPRNGIDLDGHLNTINGNHLINCSYFFTYQPGEVANNMINDKPFVFLQNEHDKVVDNAGQVQIENSNHITVKNLDISNVTRGITLYKVQDSLFEYNRMTSCVVGICTDYNMLSNRNIYRNNSFIECSLGIYSHGFFNEIRDNSFSGSRSGIDAVGFHNIEQNNLSNCNIGISTSTGSCSHNMVKNCSTGIEAGFRCTKITYNTIQDCGNGLLVYGSFKEISHNNFLHDTTDAFFINAIFNQWDGNYWEQPLSTPKIINGLLFYMEYIRPGIPWKNYDYHPASQLNQGEEK